MGREVGERAAQAGRGQHQGAGRGGRQACAGTRSCVLGQVPELIWVWATVPILQGRALRPGVHGDVTGRAQVPMPQFGPLSLLPT